MAWLLSLPKQRGFLLLLFRAIGTVHGKVYEADLRGRPHLGVVHELLQKLLVPEPCCALLLI